jgi:alpha-amylase/alpha-mannosidase (GH57 family)
MIRRIGIIRSRVNLIINFSNNNSINNNFRILIIQLLILNKELHQEWEIFIHLINQGKVLKEVYNISTVNTRK